jgi:hypothetical protein
MNPSSVSVLPLCLCAVGPPCLAADHPIVAAFTWQVTGQAQTAHAVAAGDLDGDAKPDLALTLRDDDAVAILLTGDGPVFQPTTTYDVGDRPEAIIIADINADDILDIATANRADHTVTVLTAVEGDFTRQDWPTGFAPADLAAGDVDADGDLDIVAVNAADASFTLLRNDGATFASIDFPSGGLIPLHVALTDVDADGRADVLLTNTFDDTFAYHRATPGGFATPRIFHVPDQPRDLAVGDIDADGDDDVAVACTAAKTIIILVNDAGELIPANAIDFDDAPDAVALEPFDDDDLADLIVSASHIHVFRALDDAEFELIDTSTQGIGAESIAFADVTGDARLDIAAARDTSRATIFPGRGDGRLAKFDEQSLPDCGYRLDAADFDNDGDNDVAIITDGVDVLRISVNDGAGAFTTIQDLALGNSPRDLQIFDADQDGVLDILVTTINGDRIDVFRGVGDATFIPEASIPSPSAPFRMASGLFDDDDDIDIAVTDYDFDTVSIYRAVDGAAFEFAESYVVGFRPLGVDAADIDGDGDEDLIVGSTAGTLTPLLNAAEAFFEVGRPVQAADPVDFDFADLDDDGDLDMAAAGDFFNKDVDFYRNDGAGHYAFVSSLGIDADFTDIRFADVDNNGRLDFIGVMGDVLTYVNDGPFQFQPPIATWTISATTAVPADFDNDGHLDLAMCRDVNIYGVALNLARDACPVDINADGELNVLDFVAFQLLWLAADPAADCHADEQFTILDFICFQLAFQKGCP